MEPWQNHPIESENRKKFIFLSVFHILWNFLSLHVVAFILLLNLVIFFPQVLPSEHVFVLDSADYIDELYYYGSGPQEIDDDYLKQQWHGLDVGSG